MNIDKGTIESGILSDYALRLEFEHIGRIKWWNEYYAYDKIPDTPIPQINWLSSSGSKEVRQVEKLLQDCMVFSGILDQFFSFILYTCYSNHKEISWRTVDDVTLSLWYKKLHEALPLMYKVPWPYMSDLLVNNMSKQSKQASGYFPTPMEASELMVRIIYGNSNNITKIMTDPCVGSGHMLLSASNYTINLMGQDINITVLKACRIHMYMYVPWGYQPMKLPQAS